MYVTEQYMEALVYDVESEGHHLPSGRGSKPMLEDGSIKSPETHGSTGH